MHQLNVQDQKHRNSSSKKSIVQQQKVLDQQNQLVIDSLYSIHKSYVGRSLVGEEFQYVMWSVIQHSTVEIMEKYLPIVHSAVQEKELDEGPFKMLLDRFYGLKYGYQIFGSQSGFGFKLADDKTRQEIEKKYSIN